MLKIAGVKSEKEFYKKFPTEEAFMAKYGKQLKKAAMGKSMVNKQLKQLTDFGNPPIAQDGTSTTPKFEFTNNVKADGLGATAGAAGMGALQNIGKIIGGISAMGQQKTNIKKAQMAQTISGLGLEATAGARRNQPKNQYVRPEDNLVQPDQLGSAQGVGTNFLQMKSGGEIQNTYAPGTLYNDLGYVPKAEFGEYFQDSGQAQLGSVAGEALGSAFFGPAGGAVGKVVGQVAGNLLGGAKDARNLKAAQDKTLLNQQQTAFQGTMQNQFGANMKQGGWVSHDWQPQTITKFGEYNTKDLLKPDPMMDTLRSGGHLAQVGYTAPSAEALSTERPKAFLGFVTAPLNIGGSMLAAGALDQGVRAGAKVVQDSDEAKMLTKLASGMEDGGYMAMGGALQTHWGGDAELMSYNPYIPGGGETVMFRGQSHDDTNGKGQSGIGITYGDNPVEVERGEPMTEMNGGGVVFGNMMMPGGKTKFKNYVADLSKTEAKQNKIMDKASKLALEADENDPFGRLTLNSSEASLIGANMKLKNIAQKKQDAADLQNAILDTADEMGLVADDLAKGKIKEAKFGGKFTAQNGSIVDALNKSGKKSDFASRKALAKEYGISNYSGTAKQNSLLFDKFNSANTQVYTPPTAANLTDNRGPNYNWMPTDTTPVVKPTGVKSGFDQYQNYFDASGNLVDQSGALPGAFSKDQIATGKTAVGEVLSNIGEGFEKYGQGILSNVAPFLRPTDQEGLDPAQLMGEQYALAMNQLEPVQAQKYQPQLGGVMDVSFQDQLNEITAQSRAAERMMQNNPEAAANLFAQAAQAKSKVLAEQNRMNMASRKQTFDENRNLLNQAQLQNLQILDQQYVRQAQAKSATKAQAQAALNSIADKIAKNKLENRQLGVMENMYNYRFDPKGRAINVNAPAQFNIPEGIGKTPEEIRAYADLLAAQEKAKAKTDAAKKRNGDIVKAIKLKNI